MSAVVSRVVFFLLLPLAFSLAQGQEGRRLSVYTAQTGFSLPVQERGGTDYVGLLEVLEPMGPVSANQSGNVWKLQFRSLDGQFDEGKNRAQVGGKSIDLPSRFLIENGRGLVPLASIKTLVDAFTGARTEYHDSARRLFAGATPVRYSVQLQRATPSRLVLSFSAPVNPSVLTEKSGARLVFLRDPVIAASAQATALGDPTFNSVTFAEENGAARITVSASAPLSASLADSNRTVVLTPQATTAPPAQPHTQSAVPSTGTPQQHSFFVLIDPAHGGTEPGAALSDKLAEKDAVLLFARRIQADLAARGISARLLRDTDTTITASQRAMIINSSRAGLVLAIHATTAGTGLRIATSPLPSQSGSVALPWQTAQSGAIDDSVAVASALATELLKRDVPTLRVSASVPPANQVALPFVALELAASPKGGQEQFSASVQAQAISSAIAAAIHSQRPRLVSRAAASSVSTGGHSR